MKTRIVDIEFPEVGAAMITITLTRPAMEDIISLAHLFDSLGYDFADPAERWRQIHGEWRATFLKRID